VTNPTFILDSVTHLKPEHAGAAVVAASHGGRYAGWYAATMGAGAVILNDAGIGREFAGIAGLELLAGHGIPAACLSHRSARIGQGLHSCEHGRLSFANEPARRLGLVPGMACAEALAIMSKAATVPASKPSPELEVRVERLELGRAGVRVVVLDSVSLLTLDDIGHIAVSASHGGLLGGNPDTPVKYPVFAVVVNDADRGIDDAGVSRLPALDEKGIAGACVSAFSARIGDGCSTLDDGYISAINATAVRHGGAIGQSCRAFVAAMVEARVKCL
jgi:hypothetical protein